MDEYKIGESLGEIKATLKQYGEDIKDIKGGVANYRKMKNRLIGICIGISFLVSISWKAFWKLIG